MYLVKPGSIILLAVGATILFCRLSAAKSPSSMLRTIFYLVVITTVFCIACSRNNDNGNETLLYGTWTKGTNAGDTIWFMKKDGKNIMRTNQSFNPLLPTYSETEYSFKDGKLRMILPITSSALGVIDSFTWLEYGKKFEVTGYQMYMFMSSTGTKFSFTKMQ